MNAATPGDTVVFLHIPKTAGTTVTALLERQYEMGRRHAIPPDPREIPPLEEIVAGLRALPPDQLERLDLLTGHFPFGIHEVLPRRSRYITFVRDPVERVLSVYYYIRSHPTHHLRDEAHRLALREFVEGNVSGNLHNGQTAFLAGKGIWHDRFDDELLTEALANIREHFATVGVTERLDKSILVLRRQLNWRGRVYYQSQNVNHDRPRQPLDSETRELIEGLNQLDRQLYEHANTLLDSELERLAIDVPRELVWLRARSQAFRAVIHARWRLGRLLGPLNVAGRG